MFVDSEGRMDVLVRLVPKTKWDRIGCGNPFYIDIWFGGY